jgi:cysteine desulfurase/selenocysteine lyase
VAVDVRPLNAAEVRKDFPALAQRPGGRPPVYLDSSCVTLRPRVVIDAVSEYYEKFSGCHRRTYHAFAKLTTERFERARAAVAAFLGAEEASEVVFLRNTTEGINLVARSFAGPRKPRVLTSEMEHNSNLLPWLELSRQDLLRHGTFRLAEDLSFDPDRFRKALAEGVDLVSVPHKSHVTGCEYPVRLIADLAHAAGAAVLVDGAQGAGFGGVDVRALGADFYAFSAHKMLGPSGFGALYVDRARADRLKPHNLGGETVTDVNGAVYTLADPPYRFEAGLQDYAGALGLEAAIGYLDALGAHAAKAHAAALNAEISAGLEEIKGVRVLGPKAPDARSNVVNFTVEGADAVELAEMLDKTAGIMVRAGKHCTHAWYNATGTPPSVRASLHVYNTREEAALFVKTMRDLVAHFC